MTFAERLARRVDALGTPACLGLDPHLGKVPGTSPEAPAADNAEAVRRFCLQVVDALAPFLPVLKPQSAFFEALGPPGLEILIEVVRRARAAGWLVLLDAKRGDIGSTAEAYARATLDDDGPMGADAVTVSPYLGPESLAPFAARGAAGKGVFVLLRTSNPGAEAWQAPVADGVAAWIRAEPAAGAVVGATLSAPEIRRWRAALPDTWLLGPGFGAQGAGEAEVAPLFAGGGRALVVAARSVLFGPDPSPEGLVARGQAFGQAVRRAAVVVAPEG